MKIDKDVPIPARGNSRAKYPFFDMDINESFAFEASKYGCVSSARSYAQLRTGKKFTIRKENGGYRCWRIA